MQKVILLLLLILSQSAFASGTWLRCASDNSSATATIVGNAEGSRLTLSPLKVSELAIETHGLRLTMHEDLGSIFTATIEQQDLNRILHVVLVPIERTTVMGGKAKLFILSGRNTLAQLECSAR